MCQSGYWGHFYWDLALERKWVTLGACFSKYVVGWRREKWLKCLEMSLFFGGSGSVTVGWKMDQFLPWGWPLSRPVEGTTASGSRVAVTTILPCQDYTFFLNFYYRATLLIVIYFEKNKSGTWKLQRQKGRAKYALKFIKRFNLQISPRPCRCWKRRLSRCQW